MIVSIGEALIDYKNGTSYVGGCPYNVCLAASRLGAPVSFIGGISSDVNGQRILNEIIDNRILFDPIFCLCDKRTMTATVRVEGDNTFYDFDYKDSSAFAITKKQLESVFEFNTDINCAFFGSVVFSDIEARNQIVSFLDTKPDVVRFFDPNLRMFAIDDISEYASVLDKTVSCCQIVKVSEEDLSNWGRTEDQVLDLCLSHLIVTRGSRGATWYSKETGLSVSVDAYKVDEVVDTVGCGDVFSGSVLASLNAMGKFADLSLTFDEIKTILKRAVKASALNCLKDGCNPPTSEMLDA